MKIPSNKRGTPYTPIVKGKVVSIGPILEFPSYFPGRYPHPNPAYEGLMAVPGFVSCETVRAWGRDTVFRERLSQTLHPLSEPRAPAREVLPWVPWFQPCI